jgi:polyisoprenyl-teichoic acid--peptidoglycan teichoic acid transferase
VQVAVPGGGDRVITIQVPSLQLPPVTMPASPPNPAGDPESAKPAMPLLPDWTGRERINVLLLGIDHRDDEPIDGSRSDTMMLVSVDPVTKTVVMVSLPRDLWVTIPGFGEQRINVAHAVGGPDLAMRTVSANFGLRVTNYARIDFRGFEEIISTVGGIYVDVERPIKDDEYPTEDYGYMRIYIPPGPQWMDGTTALQFARSRHSENDFGRARRQQKVLVAIKERAMRANLLMKAPELIPLAQKTVSTNFGPLDMAKLVKLAGDIDRERVVSLVIDTEYASPLITADGAEVLVPSRAAVQGAISQAFSRAAAVPAPTAVTSAPAPAAEAAAQPGPTARVEVINGTDRQGLARATADLLAVRGYEVVRVDSAERTDYPETRVMARSGQEAAATQLVGALGLRTRSLLPLPSDDAGLDIRLVLGRDYQLPSR